VPLGLKAFEAAIGEQILGSSLVVIGDYRQI